LQAQQLVEARDELWPVVDGVAHVNQLVADVHRVVHEQFQPLAGQAGVVAVHRGSGAPVDAGHHLGGSRLGG